MKVYVIQSTNGIMINIGVSVCVCMCVCVCVCEELDDWGSSKDNYMWNPSKFDCGCNRACEINEYLDIKIYSHKKVYLVN